MIGQFDAVAAHAAKMQTIDGAVIVKETAQGYKVKFRDGERVPVRFYDYEDMRMFLAEEGLTRLDVAWTDDE